MADFSSHIARVRGAAVTAKALGLNTMVSENSVRLEHEAKAEGQRAMDAQRAGEQPMDAWH